MSEYSLEVNNAKKFGDLTQILEAADDAILLIHDGNGVKSIPVKGLRESGVLPVKNGGTGETTGAEAYYGLQYRGKLAGTEENPLDLNTIVEPGIYYLLGTYFLNTPEMYVDKGVHFAHTMVNVYRIDQALIQEITPFNHAAYNSVTKRKFFRKRLSDSYDWSEWNEVFVFSDRLDAITKIFHANNGLVYSDADLNTFMDAGFYGCSSNCSNKPSGASHGNMMIVPYRATGDIYPMQVWFEHDVSHGYKSPKIWIRMYDGHPDVCEWQGWVKVMTEKDVLTGSYTGTGDAAERIIDTGGLGHALAIWGGVFSGIVTANGAIILNGDSGEVVGIKSSEIYFAGGQLKITSTNERCNASGVIYRWQVL